MSFQHFQQARCIPRVRTIVKSQRDPLACSLSQVEDVRVPALCGAIGVEEKSVKSVHVRLIVRYLPGGRCL